MPRRRKYRVHLSQETKEGIISILFFVIALLLTLSIVGSAGHGGGVIDGFLSRVFGWGRVLLPAVAAFVAYGVARGAFPEFSPRVRVGLFCCTLILFPFLAAFPPQDRDRGGRIGQFVYDILVSSLGELGAGVLLVVAMLVSLVLVTDKTWAVIRTAALGVVQVFQYAVGTLQEGWRSRSPNHSLAPGRGSIQEARSVNEQGNTGESSGFFRRALRSSRGSDSFGFDKSRTASSAPLTSATSRRYRKSEWRRQYELKLLEHESTPPTSGDTDRARMMIERTFRNFGIEVEMGEWRVGPTVTQYTLKPAEGVKISQITALHNDLALALAAHPIRIEAPIPGKSLVGIEVPNQRIAIVPLRVILESEEYQRMAKSGNHSPLLIALGQDVAGAPWIADIAKMPHLLIAGATGSGKTIMLNSIIMSLLYRNSSEELKFVLIDPKRVELPVYNGVPHLITPAITDIRKTINALRWLIGEMDRRFEELSKTGHRDISSYNASEERTMPYLVVIVDELADLMATAANEVEAAIIRLAQMARAVGIHLILATQRPSVDVITGLIKANITTRIAFSVASSIDSRTILDQPGADKLLGRGDMLYLTSDLSKPKRIQGAYVSDSDIKRVAALLRENAAPAYDDSVVERPSLSNSSGGAGFESSEEGDPLLKEAKETIIRAGKGSASLLQRRLKVGYARAARLLDLLEERGVIGPADGAKPREVLIKRNEDDTISEGIEEISPDEELGIRN